MEVFKHFLENAATLELLLILDTLMEKEFGAHGIWLDSAHGLEN
jgi:hypothetical protein